MTAPDTAIVDVDGTLVDTNYHHAMASYPAFRRIDLRCVGVPTGGFSEPELRAGAGWVYKSTSDRRAKLDDTPL